MRAAAVVLASILTFCVSTSAAPTPSVFGDIPLSSNAEDALSLTDPDLLSLSASLGALAKRSAVEDDQKFDTLETRQTVSNPPLQQNTTLTPANNTSTFSQYGNTSGSDVEVDSSGSVVSSPSGSASLAPGAIFGIIAGCLLLIVLLLGLGICMGRKDRRNHILPGAGSEQYVVDSGIPDGNGVAPGMPAPQMRERPWYGQKTWPTPHSQGDAWRQSATESVESWPDSVTQEKTNPSHRTSRA